MGLGLRCFCALWIVGGSCSTSHLVTPDVIELGLQESLAEFTAEEILDGENLYKARVATSSVLCVFWLQSRRTGRRLL